MKEKLKMVKFSELPKGASFVWTDSGDLHGGKIIEQITITKIAIDGDGMGYQTPNYRFMDGNSICYIETKG